MFIKTAKRREAKLFYEQKQTKSAACPACPEAFFGPGQENAVFKVVDFLLNVEKI